MDNGNCAAPRALTRASAFVFGLLVTCVGCGSGDDTTSANVLPNGSGGASGSGSNQPNPPRTTPESNAGSSNTGTGGTPGSAPAEVPKVEVKPGEPVTASANTWTAVPVAGTVCRDGNETGFGINPNPNSKKLIIHLEGGGACFNALTCALGSQSWTPTQSSLNASITGNTLLNRNGSSPFKDWNMVYVPYCTGDAHTGAATSGYRGTPQMGHANYVKDLQRIIATFKDLEQVVLSGMSAGGFGVGWNWVLTQDAFGTVPVSLLDDSGPPFGPEYLTPCQQQRFAELWNWQASVHPGCEDCDLKAGNVIQPMVELTMKRRNQTRFALFSYTEDVTIKRFFAYGLDDCKNWDATFPPTYPEGKFPEGLADLRTIWANDARTAMYVVTGTGHTFVRGDLSSVKTGDTSMLDWLKVFVEGGPGWTHVVP